MIDGVQLQHCYALLHSLWDIKFTEVGKANLQKAAEERKSYPDFVGLDLRCDSQFCVIYHSVPHICPPSCTSSLYIFSRNSCLRIFISQIGHPNHGHATQIKYDLSSKLLHCQAQGLRGGVAMPERSQRLQNS